MPGLTGKNTWKKQPDVANGAYIREEGPGTPGEFSPEEAAALREAGFNNSAPGIHRHWRIEIGGIKYQSRTTREVKYNNSLALVNAQYRNERVQFIQSIVAWNTVGEEEGRQALFGFRLRTISIL